MLLASTYIYIYIYGCEERRLGRVHFFKELLFRCSQTSLRTSKKLASWYFTAGTQPWNNVVLTSMRLRCFDVMCLLCYSIRIFSIWTHGVTGILWQDHLSTSIQYLWMRGETARMYRIVWAQAPYSLPLPRVCVIFANSAYPGETPPFACSTRAYFEF